MENKKEYSLIHNQVGMLCKTKEIIDDKWYDIRQKMYRNVEPYVKLMFKMSPTTESGLPQDYYNSLGEFVPGYTSRECFKTNDAASVDADIKLTEKLIKMGHETPLQGLNYIFYVSGISKSLQAQWTRHKIGVGWSFRSTRRVIASENEFIYPTLHYINNENTVRKILSQLEDNNKRAIEIYNEMKNMDVTRQDARRIMPVSFATSCFFYCNARALRHFFKLRITKEAEWEIRRLAWIMLKVSYLYHPVVYKDIMKNVIEMFSLKIDH